MNKPYDDVAEALAAESAWWAARGGHPAPSAYPEGGWDDEPCSCTPSLCDDVDCRFCSHHPLQDTCPAAADAPCESTPSGQHVMQRHELTGDWTCRACGADEHTLSQNGDDR